jgi:hypothetical protein
MEKNSGPGHCRNLVIEKGTAKWITFIDDDEIFIKNPIEDLCPEYDIYRSDVIQENKKIQSSKYSKFTCALGVIFKRSFLEINNIHFPKHINFIGTEDSAFILLCSVIDSKVKYIESFVLHIVRENTNYTLFSLDSIEHFTSNI